MAKIRKKRVLPFKGEVLVKEGEQVEPDTIIARMQYLGERPFIVDIAGPLKIELTETEDYLEKEIGDKIEVRETIAKRHKMGVDYRVKSPVSGILEHISPASGKIIIREKVNEEEIGPLEINCADKLEIKPQELDNFLEKEEGEKVEKNGLLARKYKFGGIGTIDCKSPIFGEIINIDREKGIVTVKRPVEEREIKALLPGKVIKIIPERGAIIESEGEVFKGIFGFGGPVSGILGENIVMLEKTLSRDEFDRLREDKIGIIAPSIDVESFEDMYGDQIAKGISGEDDSGITLILTEGFGDKKMNSSLLEKLEEHGGRNTLVDGRTQIRAGARRPEIIISL